MPTTSTPESASRRNLLKGAAIAGVGLAAAGASANSAAAKTPASVHAGKPTGDRLFILMQDLEGESGDIEVEARRTSDVFPKIALVETAIEDRFPGQLLASYKEWQQRTTV
ncbi:hypothetical protein ACFYE8_32710 [Rhizobium leguminosarum]|uniref:hypothetical protein n=1 Tax=Rhizobium leguminosarum TaxID=384 RepID=UPI0036DDB762